MTSKDVGEWVLVPREPTEAMMRAIWPLHHPWGKNAPAPEDRPVAYEQMVHDTGKVWSAMLSAAPLPQGGIEPFLAQDLRERAGFMRQAGHDDDADLDERAATELTTLQQQLREAREALRPFYAAVFNDNGDVTLDTSHIGVRDYLRADKMYCALSTIGEQSHE